MMSERYNHLAISTVKSNQIFSDAYVMRRQPLRESSALVRFWVRDCGLVDAVVKNVHGSSPLARLRNAWLQPCQCLSILLHGRRQLKQVYTFEPTAQLVSIQGSLLFAAQYVNELVLLALSQFEAESGLFDCYQDLLSRLSNLSLNWPLPGPSQGQSALENTALINRYQRVLSRQLRVFEQHLLQSIGFAIDWMFDIDGLEIQPLSQPPFLYYNFMPGRGFQQCRQGQFSGEILRAIATANWSTSGALTVARSVSRLQIQWCTGQVLTTPSFYSGGTTG